jgi:LmbE family N-acetylglucosaminyl deacetylase
MKKKILAIGAHSDDIEYYSGGTLIKWKTHNEITILVATDGRFNGNPSIRKKEQDNASFMMGAYKTIFLDYPDLGLEKEKQKLNRDLLRIVLQMKPDIIFSFDPENQFHLHSDFHPDHRTLSLVVIDLVFLYSTLSSYIKRLRIYEKPLSKRPELWLFDPYKANHIEDISSYWNIKLRLLQNFKTQKLNLFEVKSMASEFGKIIGVHWAEGFYKVDFCSKIDFGDYNHETL